MTWQKGGIHVLGALLRVAWQSKDVSKWISALLFTTGDSPIATRHQTRTKHVKILKARHTLVYKKYAYVTKWQTFTAVVAHNVFITFL